MTGLDMVVVKCPVDSRIAEERLEAESAPESCRMGSGWSLDSMEMYPVAEGDVGLADSVVAVEHMDSETVVAGFGMGYGSGSLADRADLAMGCRCYSKPYLRCLCSGKVA